MKKRERDRLLVVIQLVFTLSLLAILGYMLNIPSGKVVSSQITLSDYPSPFLRDGKYDFTFVTSNTVSQDEYNCAITILSGMKEIKIISNNQDLVPIGDGISNNHLKSSIRSNDLPALQDTTTNLVVDSINVHDEINLGNIGSSSIDTTSPSIESSLTKNKEYEDRLYLNVKSGSISYHYVFDNIVDLSQVSEDIPLSINFLGNELTITKIISDTEFTGFLGEEKIMNINDELTIGDKKVKLENVGQGSVVVSVNGQKEVISNGATKVIDGIQVAVTSILFNDENSIATLIIGKGVADSFRDGNLFGDCKEKCFVWDINSLLSKTSGDIYSGNGPTIGIRNDFQLVGEIGISNCIDFPNKFTSMCFDSLNVEKYSNYRIYKNSIDVSEVFPHLSSQEVITISPGHENGLEVITSDFLIDKSGNKKTSRIHLRQNSSNTIDILYHDGDNGLAWAGTYTTSGSAVNFAKVNFDKTSGDDIKIESINQLATLEIRFVPSGSAITNDNIIIRIPNMNTFTKVTYGSDEKDISNYDTRQRSRYGIIIDDIVNGIENNDLTLSIPEDQVKARIKLSGQPSQSAVTSNIPDIIQESQLTDYNKNIIAIGKDNPLYTRFVSNIWSYPEGQALINLIENKDNHVLIVAGTTSDDLQRACNVLANYYNNKNELKGFKAVV